MLTVERQGSRSVLQLHHQRNRAIMPPDPEALLGDKSATSSGDQALDHQSTQAPLEGATHSRHISAGPPSEDALSLPDLQLPTCGDNDAGSSDDNACPITGTQRRTRTYKSRDLAKPSQLGFYSGPWLDVLITAKNYYRFSMHTDPLGAFPERNTKNLDFARACLHEAISQAPDVVRDALDNGIYLLLLVATSAYVVVDTLKAHHFGMTSLVSNVQAFCIVNITIMVLRSLMTVLPTVGT